MKIVIYNRQVNAVLLFGLLLLGTTSALFAQEFSPGQQLDYKTRAIGNSWIGRVGNHMQNHITNITVFDDGTVRTQSPWDEGGNRCAEYKDGVFVRKASCNANSKIATDLAGHTWTIENYYGRFLDIHQNHGGSDATGVWRIDPVPEGNGAPYIRCSDGREIRLVADPTAIGINKVTGELLVADNTEAQNIKIFDISDEPKLVGTFGVEGGIYAGPNPGAKDDPLKFNGITGVGTDAEGNIYVACDGFPGSQAEGGGSDLRAFNPDGSLRWRMVGLMFVRAATVDPLSGGSDIYCPFTLYRVDYSKEPAHGMSDWQDVALTINPFKYPDDPRLVGAVNSCLAIVNVDGHKYMFSTDMYNEPLFVHRFEGHIAVPVAVITAGYGWNGDEVIKFRWKHNRGRPNTPRWMWVDQNGDGLAQEEEFDLFELGAPALRNFVRAISIDQRGNVLLPSDHGYWLLPTNGFDERGNLRYSVASILHIEGSAYNPRAIKWLDEIDVLVAGDGDHSHMSRVHVYDNWSDPDLRTKRFTIQVPPPSTQFSPVGGAFNIAADHGYVYVSYSVRAGPNTRKEGEVLVYRLEDGAYMGYITPGPEVGSYSGWIDMRQATDVYARPNGERIITVEEDGVGKVLIYEWCPPGEVCEGTCTIQPDSVSVSQSSLTMEGLVTVALSATVYPDTVCYDKVFWKSMNEQVAVVNHKGEVTSTGMGETWIKAISEQDSAVSDSCLVIVHNVAVEGISFMKDSLEIMVGESLWLEVSFQPDHALNRKLSWVSTNDTVIALDSTGRITALSAGSAVVTATSDSGSHQDSCYVKVTEVPVTGIAFDPAYIGMWVGDSALAQIVISPDDAADKSVSFEIKDETIALVDSSGMVTGLSPGKTWLLVTTTDQGYSDSCLIHILSPHEFGHMDIGKPCGKGNMTVLKDSVYTIMGNGIDIWHNADEFHYAYQKLSGDGVIIARVLSITNTDGWAKAGVMMREGLDAGSAFINMVVTPGNGTSFQRRPVANNACDHTTPNDQFKAPAWVKIIREGNRFDGYRSKDGKTWTLVGTQEVAMETDIYAGLSVTAHNSNCMINTSKFDHVIVSNQTDTIPLPLSSDARLADLKVDGQTVDGFDASVFQYTYLLSQDTITIPVVGASAADAYAEEMITQAQALPGAAVVTVTAEDGENKMVYTIDFTIATGVGEPGRTIVYLYPNPANNQVSLALEALADEAVAIRIFDMTGSLRYSKQAVFTPGTPLLTIDVSDLPDGMYILEAGSNSRKSFRLMIQR